MELPNSEQKKLERSLDGFSNISQTRIFWNSRKRSASGRKLEKPTEENLKTQPPLLNKQEESPMMSIEEESSTTTPCLSERRKALFEPLGPSKDITPSAEFLLPPPDFDSASYPKGWLIGKKRKLVNVDVVESMRRIAIQEMNRKDREIDGLNEQLEEDAKALEHLQLQLLQERSKRANVERENAMLQNQVSMLMNMLQDDGVENGTGEDS